MGTWMFGDGAVLRISQLAGNIQNRIVQDVNKRCNSNSQHYSPWQNFKFTSAESQTILNIRTANFETSENFYKELAKTLHHETDHPLSQSFSSSNLRLFSEINTLRPDGEKIFEDSLLLFKNSSPWLGQIYEATVITAVPIRPINPHKIESIASFSTHGALGALFVCLPLTGPGRRVEFALTLAHELAHQVVMIYQRSDALITSDLDAPVYSGTRQTHRPAIMAYHSAAALSYMLSSCLAQLNGDLLTEGELTYAQGRQQDLKKKLQANLQSLERTSKFTVLGNKLLTEMKQLTK